MVSSVSSGASALNSQSFAQLKQAQFAKADQNGDGGLSIEEFKAGAPQGAQAPKGAPSLDEAFTQFDSDRNGSLSQAELDSGFQSLSSNFGGNKVSGGNFLQLLQEQESLGSGKPAGGKPAGGKPASEEKTTAIDEFLDSINSDDDSEDDESNVLNFSSDASSLTSDFLNQLFGYQAAA
jgi:hypothetical protein